MQLSLVSRTLLVLTGTLLALDVTLALTPPARAQSSDYPANPCALDDAGWQSTDGGCKDLATGLVWGSSMIDRTGSSATHSGATRVCSDIVEGGYGDWRLPSRAELETAAANGAGAHLNISLPDRYHRWTSDIRGKKYGWAGLLSDGSGIWITLTSAVDVVCVR